MPVGASCIEKPTHTTERRTDDSSCKVMGVVVLNISGSGRLTDHTHRGFKKQELRLRVGVHSELLRCPVGFQGARKALQLYLAPTGNTSGAIQQCGATRTKRTQEAKKENARIPARTNKRPNKAKEGKGFATIVAATGKLTNNKPNKRTRRTIFGEARQGTRQSRHCGWRPPGATRKGLWLSENTPRQGSGGSNPVGGC